MDGPLILETTFLVDLEREARAGRPGAAHRFLEENPDRELCITLVTAGELAWGPRMEGRESWKGLVGHFRVLAPDLETSWIYGQSYRYLRDNGILVGANDLWIAATAVARGLPLVTRNVAHFRRVPGLSIIEYA